MLRDRQGPMTRLQALFIVCSKGTGESARPRPSVADCYFAPSFSKNKQMVSIPWWKFGMWNFSLGACRLSSGRPKPIITVGIQVVVGQAEAHHYGGDFQSFVEIVDDGNRSAAADEHRFFLERIVQRFGRGLDVRIVGTDHGGRPFAVYFDLRLDALGRKLLHEVRVALQDVVGILVGHRSEE